MNITITQDVEMSFEKVQGAMNDFDNEIDYATDDCFEDCTVEQMDQMLDLIDQLMDQLLALEETVLEKKQIKKKGGSL